MNLSLEDIRPSISESVRHAIKEDLGAGDITASLIPEDKIASAQVITRESGVLCGQAWVEEVYRQIDPKVEIEWLAQDGDLLTANQTLFKLRGSARSLLTGERCALNFLQTLSATATVTSEYVSLVKNTQLKILDTRKTIPGLRLAQKYAVTCGGGHNHRIGLYDAFLIKENHIAACGSIALAIETANKNNPGIKVEVEVESLDEFKEALIAGADIIMLDNFDLEDIKKAVSLNKQQCKIEVSGGITKDSLQDIATTGADFVSIGALTKHCRALDLSFRLKT